MNKTNTFFNDKNYPTEHREEKFWAIYGKTIATFAWIEKILVVAIILMEINKKINLSIYDLGKAIVRGEEKILALSLREKVERYKKILNETNYKNTEIIKDLDGFLEYRNILCHALFLKPNENNISGTLHFATDYKDGKLIKLHGLEGIDEEGLEWIQHHYYVLGIDLGEILLKKNLWCELIFSLVPQWPLNAL